MYDERTRQLDHQWVTYAYAREEGIEYGMQRGMEQGKIGTIVSLVEEGMASCYYSNEKRLYFFRNSYHTVKPKC